MASILFFFFYLAVPMGLAALALLGCRSSNEEVLEPIKILTRKERQLR